MNVPCMRACKILSGGDFVTDCESGSRTAAEERTRSAMLDGTHVAYELKENIMFAGVRVRSWRSASEMGARVSTGRLGVEACLPRGAQG